MAIQMGVVTYLSGCEQDGYQYLLKCAIKAIEEDEQDMREGMHPVLVSGKLLSDLIERATQNN